MKIRLTSEGQVIVDMAAMKRTTGKERATEKERAIEKARTAGEERTTGYEKIAGSCDIHRRRMKRYQLCRYEYIGCARYLVPAGWVWVDESKYFENPSSPEEQEAANEIHVYPCA